MSELTLSLLGLGVFVMAVFLYVELVILQIPLKEVFWKKRRPQTDRVKQLEAALYDIEQEALSYNHYGYAKKAREALEKK